jgi:hypothetical protein
MYLLPKSFSTNTSRTQHKLADYMHEQYKGKQNILDLTLYSVLNICDGRNDNNRAESFPVIRRLVRRWAHM